MTTTGPRRPRRGPVVVVAVLAALVLLAVVVVLAIRAVRPAATAATEIPVTGELRAHDPALVVGRGDEPWYVFSTGDAAVGGGAPQVRRSSDEGRTWELVGTTFPADGWPDWIADVVPGATNLWAPAVVEHDGTWYLYYSASTFGSNRSAIGLATSPTLDPEDPAYGWTDAGVVWRSESGDDLNAIDPTVLEDADGTPWMAFGSFWSGIRMVELAWPDGLPADPDADPLLLAARSGPPNAIEGAQVLEHDGWYYLLVSRDACCRGTGSTYNMAVGRSRDVTGPYVDRSGTPMTQDGGEPLLASRGDRVGPGGESWSDGVLAYHYYDVAVGGDVRLALRRPAWDDEGWPVLTTQAEQDQDRAGADSASP